MRKKLLARVQLFESGKRKENLAFREEEIQYNIALSQLTNLQKKQYGGVYF